MKTCPKCGHTQSEGNFCGKCGTSLISNTTNNEPTEAAATQPDPAQYYQQAPQPEAAPAQPNEQIEKLKSESKLFLSFLLQQVKSPSAHFQDVNSGLKNSLLSIGLYILLTALAIYSIIRSLFGAAYGIYDGPSIVTIVFYLALFSLLVLAVNLTSVYVTSKLFSENQTFSEIVRKIGGYFALPIALSAVSILLALISSYTVSGIILYIGIILAFGTVPTYVMIKLLAHQTKSIDGFYAFLFYIAFTAILGFLISLLIMDSAIGELIGYMGMDF